MSTKLFNQTNVSIDAIEKQKKELLEKDKNQSVRKVEFNEKNYLNVRLKNGESVKKIKIRILPITPTNPTPFLVLKTHSLKVDSAISRSGYKSFICLDDPHLDQDSNKGKCPLCAKADELFAESKKETNEVVRKTLFKTACSYKTKETFVVRVIDRDHEDEGVKFWRFNAHSDGTGCYDKLMDIYENRKQESIESGDDEPYNVFDLNNGKDFIITLKYNESTKKTTIEIGDAGRGTPLSDDYEKAMSWINDEKTWNDIYAAKSHEYIQIVANGEIPVFNKEEGKWVARVDDNSEQEENIQIANSVLSQSVNIQPTTTIEEEDDDLPF